MIKVIYTYQFSKQSYVEEYNAAASWAAMTRFAQLCKVKNIDEVSMIAGGITKLHHKNAK